MKTVSLIKDNKTLLAQINKRIAIREMLESAWIDNYVSGTLRKNKKIGFSYRQQYLHERVIYEFGWGFEIFPRSHMTFGDALTEGDCKPITEAGWFIERYIALSLFSEDKFEAKYINVDSQCRKAEGVGIVVRQSSAAFIPSGHVVFAIVAEFDTVNQRWLGAVNPF